MRALLISCATALLHAPARRQQRAATMTMSVELVGATKPMGYFDPLGFSRGKTLEQMQQYREAELKHGRISMAAMLGWFVTSQGFHPFLEGCGVRGVDDPIKNIMEIPALGWLQVIAFCGLIEFVGIAIKKDNPDKQPGDFLGAFDLVDNTDEGWVDYQEKELNNGRLAMVAIAGIWAQEALGAGYGDILVKPMLWPYLGPQTDFAVPPM